MPPGPNERRARDIQLIDAIDNYPRSRLQATLWRVSRDGRDPLQGSRSASRWCNGDFDVLYTSFERDGALAEVHSLLTLQPVFPSKLSFRVHRLSVTANTILNLADLAALAPLGVATDRYRDRTYDQTQPIADAAYFLGFDGLVAPSARWPCLNAVLFTERIELASLAVEQTEDEPVDWSLWRSQTRKKRG